MFYEIKWKLYAFCSNIIIPFNRKISEKNLSLRLLDIDLTPI